MPELDLPDIPEGVSAEIIRLPQSVGCNETWMTAAYHSRTKRVLILHDDDTLAPEFGPAYSTILAPALDERKAGFVSWKPELKSDDGKTEPCAYWEGDSMLMPSEELLKVVNVRGRLSLSPVVSIFNRTVLIRACKEAQEKLTGNASILRPGMTLGTEILVYLRHIQTYKRWLYWNQILSYYGKHDGSGTVEAQRVRRDMVLGAGYDVARDIGMARASEPTPRLILVHAPYEAKNMDEDFRNRKAASSWRFHVEAGMMLDFPYYEKGLPKFHAVIDHAAKFALPEDIIVYVNEDAGLTTHATERIIEGVNRGRGVTCLGTRSVDVDDSTLLKDLLRFKQPGGIDAVAMTQQWWAVHRGKMPDMFIGREAWDACFAALAQEWADGRALSEIGAPDLWPTSRAHTDNVCWHRPHVGAWQQERFSDTQKYNREQARIFFAERNHANALAILK
jgi:hypothetical protein